MAKLFPILLYRKRINIVIHHTEVKPNYIAAQIISLLTQLDIFEGWKIFVEKVQFLECF